jgi:hypothetical protein
MQSAPGDVVPAHHRLNAAFYAAPVSEFLAASDEEAYAPLAAPKGYTLAPEQLSAWHLQLPVLRAALADLPAGADAAAPAPWIHLEFDIPRLSRRVDAVLVTTSCIIPIEFKVGAKKFERLDYEQAWDYGLDLKNFHTPSHAAPIFPILCVAEYREGHPLVALSRRCGDGVSGAGAGVRPDDRHVGGRLALIRQRLRTDLHRACQSCWR